MLKHILGSAAARLRVAAFFFAFSCSAAAAEQYPQRIVSLVPSITETLFAIGAGDRVVGVSRFCDFPPQVLALPKVGGLVDRSFEAIAALRPDAIVGMPEGTDSFKKLQALGPKVVIVKQESIEDIYASVLTLGEVFGTVPQAQKLERELRNAVDEIKLRVGTLPRPTVLVSLGGERGTAELLSTLIAGKGTYLDELVTAAGGINVYQGSVPYPNVSAEGVIAMNPDVVLELLPEGQKSGPTVEQVLAAWAKVPQIRAVKNNRVHVLRAEYTVNPGPRFVLTLKDIAQLLHPATMPNTAAPSGAQTAYLQ